MSDWLEENYSEEEIEEAREEIEAKGYDPDLWYALCNAECEWYNANTFMDANPQYVDSLADWAEEMCYGIYGQELDKLPDFISAHIDWEYVAKNELILSGDYSYANSPDLSQGAFIVWQKC